MATRCSFLTRVILNGCRSPSASPVGDTLVYSDIVRMRGVTITARAQTALDESLRGKSIMTRMKIRHLMMLVLYASVALTVIRPVLRLPVRDRGFLVCAATLFAASALAELSWLIHRTGPRRDWLVNFFLWSAMMSVAAQFAVAFVNGRISDPFPVGFVCLLFGFDCILLARQKLIPRGCPRCGRKALLKATPRIPTPKITVRAVAYICESCRAVTFRGRWEADRACLLCGERVIPCNSDLSAHCVCESCGAITYARRGRIAQGCARCGRSRWADSPVPDRWEYYWCLACEARSKRRVDGTWEEARSPQDDWPYAQWDFVGWAESVLRRWVSSIGAGSGSSDPRAPEPGGRPIDVEDAAPAKDDGSRRWSTGLSRSDVLREGPARAWCVDPLTWDAVSRSSSRA